MLSDDIVTNRQSQARAIFLRCKEWIKKKRQSLITDRWARIVEIHAHALAILAGIQIYSDPARPVRFHRFYGIQAQVNENLF